MAVLQTSDKSTAHPAVGGTALSRSACALPLSLRWGFETTSKKISILEEYYYDL
jgi:hypothetical protein